jgi:hypothetical protein
MKDINGNDIPDEMLEGIILNADAHGSTKIAGNPSITAQSDLEGPDGGTGRKFISGSSARQGHNTTVILKMKGDELMKEKDDEHKEDPNGKTGILSKEQLEALLQSAKAQKENNGHSLPTKVFMKKNSTVWFRPLADPQGNFFAKKMRHLVTEPSRIEIGCLECRICKHLESLPYWDTKWRFKGRPIHYGYGVILDQKGLEKKYALTNQVVLLIHDHWEEIIKAIARELGSTAALDHYFDPNIAVHPAKVTFGGKSSDYKVTIDPTRPKEKLSVVATGCPPLSESYELKTDEQLVVRFIDAINANWQVCTDRRDRNTLEPAPCVPCSSLDPWDRLEEAAPACDPVSFGRKPSGGLYACTRCDLRWDCDRMTNATPTL